jgi:hypothetical protein
VSRGSTKVVAIQIETHAHSSNSQQVHNPINMILEIDFMHPPLCKTKIVIMGFGGLKTKGCGC